jgi:T5SS/PEP-CTERM-associated repeat protein
MQRLLIMCAAMTALMATEAARAVDYSWNKPLGGSFTTAGNWTSSPPGGPPGPGGAADTVSFSLGVAPASRYTVTGVTGQNGSLRVGGDTLRLHIPVEYTVAGGAIFGTVAAQTADVIIAGDAGAILDSVFANIGNVSSGLAEVTVESLHWETGTLKVGFNGPGSLTVTGADAALTGNAIVGVNAPGTLTIENGAQATLRDFDFVIGDSASGVVVIDGGSVRTGHLARTIVGRSERGSLDIRNGGRHFTETLHLGSNLGVNGALVLDGAGSTLDVPFFVSGLGGTGSTTISNGGAINSGRSIIGFGGNGSATVSGAGSRWACSLLEVGFAFSSHGVLTITDGGNMSSAAGALAVETGSEGDVTVEGVGSRWDVADLLRVGDRGAAQLDVVDGGQVTSGSAVIGGLGGTATISGAGSRWDVAASLHVAGGSDLIVSGGGQVSSGSILVSGFGSPGVMTIEGGGASVMTFGLSVGGAAPGEVEIREGGALTTLGVVPLGVGGVVHLDGGALSLRAFDLQGGEFQWSAGTLRLTGAGGFSVSPSGMFGQHVLLEPTKLLEVAFELRVEDASTLYSSSSLLAGTMSIAPAGKAFVGGPQLATNGGIVNRGDLTFTRPTVISGPVNNVSGAAITALEDVTFQGAVTGAGGFYGAGTKAFNGGLSIGASPATVEFEGDVALGDNNTLVIELGGLNPGAEYDQLQVGGVATLDGALEVGLINGFTPAIGDAFGFLFAAGGFGGSFDELALPDLGPGKAWQLNPGGATVFLNVIGAYSADFDEDGDVDGDDLNQWEGDFGANDLSDADEDGDSDGHDFLEWQRQLGSGVAAVAAGGTVPEPGGMILFLLAVGIPIRARRYSA